MKKTVAMYIPHCVLFNFSSLHVHIIFHKSFLFSRQFFPFFRALQILCLIHSHSSVRDPVITNAAIAIKKETNPLINTAEIPVIESLLHIKYEITPVIISTKKNPACRRRYSPSRCPIFRYTYFPSYQKEVKSRDKPVARATPATPIHLPRITESTTFKVAITGYTLFVTTKSPIVCRKVDVIFIAH